MPNPVNITNITPPRVPLMDERTGLISREWYRFFLNLFQLTGSGSNQISLTDLQYGPPPIRVEDIPGPAGDVTPSPGTAEVTASLNDVRQELETLPSPATAEVTASLNEVRQELETLPRNELGTMAPLQQANMPWMTFNTAGNGTPPDVGTVAWDGGTTLGVQATSNVLVRVGEAEYIYVKASSAITKGQVCMHTGAVGASGALTAAPATSAGVTTGWDIIGIAAETIALNGFGLIQCFGVLRNVNTSGYSDGDTLYWNPAVTGGYTKTVPSAPNVKALVGEVLNGGSAGGGSILVRLLPGSVLGGTDSNVQFGTLANGDLIQYDSTLQYWKNVSAGSVIAGSSGAPVTKTANFSVANGETWIINNKSGSSCTATLPAASSNTGRVLYFQNYQAQTLVSASSNVVPMTGGAAGTAILSAVAGDTATLVSDGTNWIMMQYTPNNVLLLE